MIGFYCFSIIRSLNYQGFQLLGFDPCRPKGSPLWYFFRNPFLAHRKYILTLRGSARQKKRDFFVNIFRKVPKNGFFDCFFKNFGTPKIYTNFEGERAPKKTRFFCQHFSKSAQKRLFWLFFQKFACGAENFAKIGVKQRFGRAEKSIWST